MGIKTNTKSSSRDPSPRVNIKRSNVAITSPHNIQRSDKNLPNLNKTKIGGKQ